MDKLEVSRRLTEAGITTAVFTDDELYGPRHLYVFAVERDPHGRLWLAAFYGRGVQLAILLEPSEAARWKALGRTDGRIMTDAQWKLVNELAVDSKPERR